MKQIRTRSWNLIARRRNTRCSSKCPGRALLGFVILTEMCELNYRERVKKAKLDKENQERALEQLDKMMEDFMDSDLPGMCLNFAPPPNSRSDGNICNRMRTQW